MFLLGFHRKLTALPLCKSIESAIQWFQIHHRVTFASIQNSAVYLSGARVSFFPALVPRLLQNKNKSAARGTQLVPIGIPTFYLYNFEANPIKIIESVTNFLTDHNLNHFGCSEVKKNMHYSLQAR